MAEPQHVGIREVLLQALDRPEEEREAFLQHACEGDEELKAEMRSFVAEIEHAWAWSDQPLPAASAPGAETVSPTGEAELHEGPGTWIGPYELLQVLGEGGFGVVFVAEQHYPIRRRVALKIIKPGMDTKQVVARFETERQALSMMDHPNIAKVLDAGETETGRPYFVMEWVRGVPITDYCDSNNSTTEERLKLLIPVCSAVQHAHQKAIIHRDLKPSNVLVTVVDDKPIPKIIDFGIAKALNAPLTERAYFTESGQFVGTPEYMSPEQAGMGGQDVDTRSDVYSLGVLLYELLTGTTPFDPKKLRELAYDEIRKVIREEEPPTPSTRLSSLGQTLTTVAAHRRTEPSKLIHRMRRELDWIVMKCLDKDRRRRYDAATSLAMDIERYIKNEPVIARPASTGYRIQKFMRRHSHGVVMAAVICCAYVVLLVLLAVIAQKAMIAKNVATESQKREKIATLDASRMADRYRIAARDAAVGLIYLGDSLTKSNLFVEARDKYAKAWDAMRELGMPEAPAVTAIMDTSGQEPPIMGPLGERNGVGGFEGHKNHINVVIVRKDGRRAITGSEDYWIRMWDLATGREIPLLDAATGKQLEHSLGVAMLALAPDDRTLLSSSHSGEIWAYEIETGRKRELAARSDKGVWALAISPDGTIALSGDCDGRIRKWDLRTFRELPGFQERHKGAVGYLAFSPDGQSVLSGGGDAAVKLWKVDTGALIKTVGERLDPGKKHLDQVNCIAFLPGGREAISASFDHTIKKWRLSDETPSEFMGHDGRVWRVAISPNGETMLSGSSDETVRLWNTATRLQMRTFLGQTGRAIGVAFSPSGEIAVASGLVGTKYPVLRVWDCRPDIGFGPADLSAAPASIAVTNDLVVLFALPDGRIAVWDAPAKRSLRTLSGHNGAVKCLAINGTRAISIGADGLARLWDLGSGGGGQDLPVRIDNALSVAFTDRGPVALAAAGGGVLRLVDLQNGQTIATYTGAIGAVRCAAISQDGSRIVAGEDNGLRIWDSPSGTARAFGEPALSLTLSPKGEIAWTIGADGRLRTWDVVTGKLIRTLPGHGRTDNPTSGTCIAISPDGTRVVSGAADKTLRLCDLTWPGRFREFEIRVKADRAKLPTASAWATLGQWHAFRQKHDWAVECLEKARAGGERVSPLELARCYWRLSGRDPGMLRLANREFRSAREQNEAPAWYLDLCIRATEAR